ncbi:MAG: hypothetical protein WC782_12795 [Methylococcaceae bacterium]|jgi:hypothetical protein
MSGNFKFGEIIQLSESPFTCAALVRTPIAKRPARHLAAMAIPLIRIVMTAQHPENAHG